VDDTRNPLCGPNNFPPKHRSKKIKKPLDKGLRFFSDQNILALPSRAVRPSEHPRSVSRINVIAQTFLKPARRCNKSTNSYAIGSFASRLFGSFSGVKGRWPAKAFGYPQPLPILLWMILQNLSQKARVLFPFCLWQEANE
jgi:hypothetical protein